MDSWSKKINLKPAWLWLIFYLFIFALLLNHSFNSLDNDYGWHWKFGQDIWQSKSLPEAQIHMWPLAGQTWVDHEWLSNLLTFALASAGGYVLVSVFYSLIITLLMAYLAILVKRQEDRGDYFIMLWQVFGLAAIMGHLGVRIQEIGLIFFSVLLIILQKYNNQKNLLKLSLILMPLFWLWASFHASFVIGLIIIWLFIVCRLVARKVKPKLDDWALATGPLLATLLTPYGLKLYDLLSEYRHTAYMSQIGEWLPIYSFPLNYYKLLFLAIIISLSLLLWLRESRLVASPEPVEWMRQYLFIWTLLFMLLLFSLRSVRHFQLLFVASHIFLVPLFIRYLGQDRLRINHFWLNFFIAAALINLLVWQLVNTPFTQQPFTAYDKKYPVGAVNYLREHSELKSLRLLNHYDWGGYLIATLPDWTLFADGRLPQKLYKGRPMIEVFSDFNQEALVADKLADYQIELVLWKTQQPFYQLSYLDKFFGFEEEKINYPRNFLRYYLMTSPEWRRIYGDGTAEIYVKNVKFPISNVK